MIIEYDSIYTEFPAELLDAAHLLDVLCEQARGYAQAKGVELLEGPPEIMKEPDNYRFVARNYCLLKWPALRVFFSVNDAESII